MKIIWAVMSMILLFTCAQSEVKAAVISNINQGGKLIQSYTVDDQWETIFNYNADNTLKEIIYKTDGEVKCTKIFTYKNGKIVESLLHTADGATTVTMQYEYKGDVIVKKTERSNDGSIITSNFKYDKDNFLEKITTTKSFNSYESTTVTTIEKLPEENKIKVSKTNVATHVITYDDTLAPEAAIPEYQPIVRIMNNGMAGNILLKEIFSGDECTTTIRTDIQFEDDGTTVLSSKTTTKSINF
ncbi:MAG: hypothetical protein N4A71_02275 [Carboxylicivirga sp.]|jgi:hypothetical protein|nr:hypothetical protein [Carboxylicivirga sp.]